MNYFVHKTLAGISANTLPSGYALNEYVIVMIEYHYNGAGSNNTDDYHELATQAPYQKAGVYLYRQHYIITVLTWLASQLISVSADVPNNEYTFGSELRVYQLSVYASLRYYFQQCFKMKVYKK